MSETEVRSVLVPVAGSDLLMPNAAIAEIVAYNAPEPIEQAPDWVLGHVLWHGWKVPVIAFGMLTEQVASEPTQTARICVTKCLIGHERMPYIGILAQGFPRLVTVTEDAMTEVPEGPSHIAIAGRALVRDHDALLPDLDRIGQLVAHAAYGALPVAG